MRETIPDICINIDKKISLTYVLMRENIYDIFINANENMVGPYKTFIHIKV